MSFLKLDTRPKPADILPEGRYRLLCTNAKYTLKDKEKGITADNVKGLLCSFQFKANGKTGELVHNFNLFHHDDQVRKIGIEEFGNMCKAMGFTVAQQTGHVITSAGEVIEPHDLKFKGVDAHIIVKPHWQNPEQWQNVVKSWVMPTNKADKVNDSPSQNQEPDNVDDVPYDSDVPF